MEGPTFKGRPMELKNILEAFVGACLALLLGPVVKTAMTVILDRMEAREARRHSEAVTRKAMAIVEDMRWKSGKKWYAHGPEDMDFHNKDRGIDCDYV